MNRSLLLVGILLLSTFSVIRADTPPETSATPAPITEPAVVAAHYREFVTRPEYRENVDPDINARLKDYFAQWFQRIGIKFGEFQYSSEMPAFASLLMTLLVILSISGLLYVIYRLTRRREEMETSSVPRHAGPKTFRSPEFYEDEIQQAIKEGNWHAAWLAGWRQFLSRLENRRLVEADRTRTNREYLAQLRAQALPSPAINLLSGMVDDYDRTIYGRRPVSEPDWSKFHQQIEEAGLLLHLDEKRAQVRPTAPAT